MTPRQRTYLGLFALTFFSFQTGRAVEGGIGKFFDLPFIDISRQGRGGTYVGPQATPIAGGATTGEPLNPSQNSFTADSAIAAFNLRDGNGNRLSASALTSCPAEPADWCFMTTTKAIADIPAGLKPDAVDGDPCQDGVTYLDNGGQNFCFDAVTVRPGMRR